MQEQAITDMRQLKNLKYGQVFLTKGPMPFTESYANYYYIFLGFTAVNNQLYFKNWIESNAFYYNKGKEYDIYAIINQINRNFICLPVTFSFSPLTDDELGQAVKQTLQKPSPLCRLAKGFALINSVVSITDYRVATEDIDAFRAKQKFSSFASSDIKNLWSIEEYYKRVEEVYDKLQNKGINSLKTVTTTEYKPRHFYLYNGPKTTRLYYCLSESKEKGNCYFVLLYMAKTFDDTDSAKIVSFLNRANNPRLLYSCGIKKFTMKKDKPLEHIIGVEAKKQSIGFDAWVTLTNDRLFDRNLAERDVNGC